MSTTTTNLGLTKPAGDELIDIAVWNTNMDLIDAAVGELQGLVTKVKGDAESEYRTGNVNLTPANIGAAAAVHSHDAATTSSAGFMSSTDKSKLNGIASGAQVNSITGVKGNAESSYRTGNVNLTPANIGAASQDSVAKGTISRNQDIAAGAELNFSVTFSKAFSSVPVVVLDTSNDGFTTQIESVSKTGFSGWICNVTSWTKHIGIIYWIAIA